MLGVINRVITGRDGKIVAYEVKGEGEVTHTFPIEQFKETPRGLIFQPLWYTEIDEFIRELEFQETLIPEISELTTNGLLSKEQLGEMLERTQPRLKRIVDDAIAIRDSLRERLADLKTQRLILRREMSELSGQRLLGEVDRHDFAEKIVQQRRKVQTLERAIKKCQELLIRLERSPFVPHELEAFSDIKKIEREKPPAEKPIAKEVKETKEGVPAGTYPFVPGWQWQQWQQWQAGAPPPPSPLPSPPEGMKIRKLKVLKSDDLFTKIEQKINELEKMVRKLPSVGLDEVTRSKIRLDINYALLENVDTELKSVTDSLANPSVAKDAALSTYLKQRQVVLSKSRKRLSDRIAELLSKTEAEEKPEVRVEALKEKISRRLKEEIEQPEVTTPEAKRISDLLPKKLVPIKRTEKEKEKEKEEGTE